MTTVLLPFVGAQSCGYGSFRSVRRTANEPLKSEVVGLCCSALGIRRGDRRSIAEVASLRMGVRVDLEPRIGMDFLTAGGGSFGTLTMYEDSKGNLRHMDYGVARANGKLPEEHKASLCRKYYLTDAFFLVILEGGDAIVRRIHEALGRPVFGLSLGRKCYKPTIPMKLKDGIVDEPIEQVIRTYKWLPSMVVSPFSSGIFWIKKMEKRVRKDGLRTVVEVDNPKGCTRRVCDVPISFSQEDRIVVPHRYRYVNISSIPFPEETR